MPSANACVLYSIILKPKEQINWEYIFGEQTNKGDAYFILFYCLFVCFQMSNKQIKMRWFLILEENKQTNEKL